LRNAIVGLNYPDNLYSGCGILIWLKLISIYLVDDHELVRTGIRRILEDERGIKVVGEAPDGETAVQWARQNEADVILMDMNMPGMGGLEATRKILRYQPHAKIIVLTVHTEDPFPRLFNQRCDAT